MRVIKLVRVAVLSAAFVVQVGVGVGSAQTPPVTDQAKRFVGTWRLVSETQTGLMIYDSLGNMAAQVMPKRERQKYAAAQPTPAEAKDAITGYLAYFGTYTVDESTRTIRHHRLANLNPGQIGDDAVRRYEFTTNDTLVLVPAESGNPINWVRAK